MQQLLLEKYQVIDTTLFEKYNKTVSVCGKDSTKGCACIKSQSLANPSPFYLACIFHILAKRATPNQMSDYKHALQLHRLFNSTNMSDDWLSLNFQQNFNGRSDKVQIYNVSRYKVGRNLLVNRFRNLNNKIDYLWLNESLNAFKIKCKQLLL